MREQQASLLPRDELNEGRRRGDGYKILDADGCQAETNARLRKLCISVGPWMEEAAKTRRRVCGKSEPEGKGFDRGMGIRVTPTDEARQEDRVAFNPCCAAKGSGYEKGG